jgi:Transposase DDE domain
MTKRMTRRPVPATVPSCLPAGGEGNDDLVGRVEALLRELVEGLAPDLDPATRGRPRVLPGVCLWAGLTVGVLRGHQAVADLWRLLSWHGLWDYRRFAISDEAVYKRLAADDGQALARLFASVSAALAPRLAPLLPLLGDTAGSALAPWASEVVALDEMALDQIARLLPTLRGVPAGATALLPGTLTALFDLRRQQFVRVDHRLDVLQNEKVLARHMVADLPRGSLILGDLGYFAFEWFDDLTTAGQYWISRLRAKTTFTVRHVFYQSAAVWDGLVWLGKYRADRAAQPVRLVRFTMRGTTWTYITNVLDPRQLSLHEIAVLYARRWDIELAFKFIKRELGLHLLWAAKPALVVQQLYAVLCIAQIVQALRLELAARAGVDPFEISLPLFLRVLPTLARAGQDPLTVLVERGEAAAILRPSRRTRIITPDVDHRTLIPAPPHLLLPRKPRYAHRKCAAPAK